MINQLILDFSRFEFKYVLQKSLRESVESELGFFMQLDPFVRDTELNRYCVRSLYFDDPLNTAFYDKVDGLKDRSKFRLRTYTRTPDAVTPVFLEQKGRSDNRVFKHRVLISESSLNLLHDRSLKALLLEQPGSKDYSVHRARNTQRALEIDKPANPVITKFQYDWFRKEIRPVALIDYMRTPYISKYDHEFRVTFDEQLSAYETDQLFPNNQARHRQLLPGYTVMEVKFNKVVPAWFHRIIQSYELRRVPLSKICEGMKKLNLAVEL